jgi:hypothetical protein
MLSNLQRPKISFTRPTSSIISPVRSGFEYRAVKGAFWPRPHRPSQRYKSLVVSYQEVVHAQALCEGIPPGGL